MIPSAHQIQELVLALHIEIDEPYIKLPLACRILGISRPTLVKLIESGKLRELARDPHVDEHGRTVYVPRNRKVEVSSIEEYLASRGA